MRINYNLATFARTGGVRVVLEVTSRLAARGHEVTITNTEHPRRASWFPITCDVIWTRSRALYVQNWLARLFRKARYAAVGRRVSNAPLRVRYIDRLLTRAIPRCDINVATAWATVFPTLHSATGVPFYHMQHFEAMFVQGEPELELLARQTYTLDLKKFANSSWLSRTLRDEFGIEVPIIHPGIDHTVFYPRSVATAGNKRTVVTYGKKTPWKGFRDAMAAMAIVSRQRQDVEWIVYGSEPPTGGRENRPYRFVRSPDDEELAALYSVADVVVCPSWCESFPLPPLEAMACGAPVVTTRPGTEDYAVHEVNALVVPPKDPQALAKAVLRLLTEAPLAKRLREAGPETARRFQWDRTIDRLEALFAASVPG